MICKRCIFYKIINPGVYYVHFVSNNFFSIFLVCVLGMNTSFVCAADDADSLKSKLPTAQENQTPLVIASDEDIFNIYLKKHEDILPDCSVRLHTIIDEIWPLQIAAARNGEQSVHVLDAMVGRELHNLLDIAKKLELGTCLPLPEALAVAREVNYMKDVFEKVEAVLPIMLLQPIWKNYATDLAKMI